jgi:hypothetical protein
MSSPLTHATLVGLFTAPLVGLAVLAVLARPVAAPPVAPVAAAAGPSVGIWRVVCPPDGWGWGPYSSPDACRHRLETTQRTCTRPLLDPTTPNPEFQQIAAICREAYNATHCSCEFQLAVARVQTTGEFLSSPTPTEVLFPATAQ